MTSRSTVSLERDLLRRVDTYATARGLPAGPGHRAQAVTELLEVALAARGLDAILRPETPDEIRTPPEGENAAPSGDGQVAESGRSG